jgi:hypothetical protein
MLGQILNSAEPVFAAASIAALLEEIDPPIVLLSSPLIPMREKLVSTRADPSG